MAGGAVCCTNHCGMCPRRSFSKVRHLESDVTSRFFQDCLFSLKNGNNTKALGEDKNSIPITCDELGWFKILAKAVLTVKYI